MNREQAKNYLRSSGMSEEQIRTITEALALQYKEGWNDGYDCAAKNYKKAFEDIRAEIKEKAKCGMNERYCDGLRSALLIIDRHTSGKDAE